MSPTVDHPTVRRHRRPFHARWATVLALVAVVFLAACGTNEAVVPTYEEPVVETPYEEEVVGPDPIALATFVSEAEAEEDSGAVMQTLGAGARPFEHGADQLASRGGYVAQPETISPASTGAAVAQVPFDLPVADTYTLWVRMFAPSKNSDATYLGFDGATRRVFAPELRRYVWVKVVTEELDEGRHAISLGHGEPNLRIDLFAVTRRGDVGPDDLDVLVLPAEPVEPTDPESTDPEPTDPESTDPEPTDPAPQTPDLDRGFSLLGDASFHASSLSGDQRLWFDRALSSVQGSVPAMESLAQRDDSYYQGRTLFQFSASALLGLRSTGDLRFLDALDPMMQVLREQLYDGWCDGVESSVYVNSQYGTVLEDDGFRNFRVRYESGQPYCRDTGDLNEALAHGHLAMVMYAYHVNRDLVSPAGVDYGERADFWFEYLRNDFEAKWRGRTDVSWPAMDFIELKFSHTYNVFTLYYYFMGQRLASVGDPDAAAYLDEAASMTDAMFDQAYVPGERAGGFVEVSAPTGDAVVYSFGAPGRGTVGETHLEASPMTYSRYAMSAMLALRLEGMARWDDAAMMRLSNGLTSYVLDVSSVASSSDSFAAGVTGSEAVAGIPATTYRGRLAVSKYVVGSIPAFVVWDQSGTIESLSLQAYDATESDPSSPSNAGVPASMLFVEVATANDLGFTASR